MKTKKYTIKELEDLGIDTSKLKNTEWIPFTFKGKKYEVQKNLNPKVKYSEIKIPKGCQLMTSEMAGYIYDNDILELSDDWEWIEHYSQKMKKKGYECRVSLFDVNGDRLFLGGYDWDVDRVYRAFGVRFVREVLA